MNKEESKALHELVRERVSGNSENPTFILITCDGPQAAASIEGNAWDLITALACIMDDKPEIGKVLKQAAMVHSMQSMSKGLKNILTLLDEVQGQENEPAEDLEETTKEN